MERLLALAIVAACYSPAAVAEWIMEIDAGILHDSNLSNAEPKPDIRSDTALVLTLAAGPFVQLDRNLSLTWTADVRSETYHHFSGLTHVSAGTTVALRHKFGTGAAAPWLRLSASAARLEFNDNVRDGWYYRTALTAGQRWTERWDVHAQYSLDRRTGDHERAALRTLSGDAFDLASRTLTLGVRYSLTDATLFFASASWRDGEVVSTSTPTTKIFRSASAITRDPVFGANSFAYKLDAVSRLLQVGMSQAVDSKSAFSISYQRQITHAEGDNNYFKNVFAAMYTHSFF